MSTAAPLLIAPHDAHGLRVHIDRWRSGFLRQRQAGLHADPRWLPALQAGLRQRPYCLEAIRGEETVGLLPLMHVRSLLFGSFLVGLPYVNSAGVLADSEQVADALIEQAAQLADTLQVRYLELRHEQPHAHRRLTESRTDKVHMRLPLPETADALWNQFDPKVRNQIRKGRQQGFSITWGRGAEELAGFYRVFAHTMRDLGTPVFGESLFAAVLREFADEAEICLLREGRRPVAAALLLHGGGMTEVPSAAALRACRAGNANMLMYWHLLQRAIERGSGTFDFGRSSRESGTYRFKRQWGAAAHPAHWQYYLRQGEIGQMRPEHPRYGRLQRLWRRLPVWASRLIGPPIVRGIP